MRKFSMILIFILLLVTDAGAHIFSVCGFPSVTAPAYVQVTDITTLSSPSVVVSNTSTGVVSRQQENKYCIYYSYTPTSGHDYEARFEDSSATPLEGTDVLTAEQTYLDAAISSLPSDSDNASAVWAAVSEGSYSYAEIMRLISSTLFGKASGGGTATITFRDVGDTKDRVTMTVDSSGNRTAVTLNGSN